MLQGYFDDSGSDGQRQPFTLAGYMLPSEKWASFADDWSAELAREPQIDYFKMYEAVNGEGQFNRYQYDIRRYKIIQLIEVIKRHDPVGIGLYFRWSEWREFSKRVIGSAKDNPYGSLFFLLIDAVRHYQELEKIFPSKIQLDFDEQGKAGQNALQWYCKLMDPESPFPINAAYREMMEGTPRMLNDKQYVPLQAADLLAGAARMHFDESLKDPVPDFRWVYDQVRPTFWGLIGYNNESWKALLRTIRR